MSSPQEMKQKLNATCPTIQKVWRHTITPLLGFYTCFISETKVLMFLLIRQHPTFAPAILKRQESLSLPLILNQKRVQEA